MQIYTMQIFSWMQIILSIYFQKKKLGHYNYILFVLMISYVIRNFFTNLKHFYFIHKNSSLPCAKQILSHTAEKSTHTTKCKWNKFANCCEFMSQFLAFNSFNLIIIYSLAFEWFQHGYKSVDMALESITNSVDTFFAKKSTKKPIWMCLNCFVCFALQKCVQTRTNLFSSWRYFHSVTHLKRVSFASLNWVPRAIYMHAIKKKCFFC